MLSNLMVGTFFCDNKYSFISFGNWVASTGTAKMKATIKNIYIVEFNDSRSSYLAGEFNSLDLRQLESKEKEYYFVKELNINVDGRKHSLSYSDIIQGMKKTGYIQANENSLMGTNVEPTEKLKKLMDKLDIDKLKKMYYGNNNEFLKMELMKG